MDTNFYDVINVTPLRLPIMRSKGAVTSFKSLVGGRLAVGQYRLPCCKWRVGGFTGISRQEVALLASRCVPSNQGECGQIGAFRANKETPSAFDYEPSWAR